jgi:hypothetical protein
MTNLKRVFLLFIILALLPTLFPPFNWGEERLQTVAERRERIVWGPDVVMAQEILPIKKQAFLFSDSKRQFEISGSG